MSTRTENLVEILRSAQVFHPDEENLSWSVAKVTFPLEHRADPENSMRIRFNTTGQWKLNGVELSKLFGPSFILDFTTGSHSLESVIIESDSSGRSIDPYPGRP